MCKRYFLFFLLIFFLGQISFSEVRLRCIVEENIQRKAKDRSRKKKNLKSRNDGEASV